MLLKLLPFELKQQIKQGGFWAAAVAMVWMAILITTQRGSALLYANSAHAITQTLLFIAPNIIFVICVLASATVLRDNQYKMEPLIFSTPIDKFKYLGSRYLSIALAGGLVLLLALIAMMITPFFLAPELVGPFHLSFYLANFLIFIVPSILLCTSLVFAAAMLSKSMITVFVSGIVLYVVYIIGSIMGNSPLMAGSSVLTEGYGFASLLEPYGLIAFMEQSAYWSVEQRNTFLPALSGDLLFNRILWLAISFSLFVFTYKTFTFRAVNDGKKAPEKASSSASEKQRQEEISLYQSIKPAVNFDKLNLSVAWSKFKIEYFTATKGKVFIVLMITTIAFTLGNLMSSILEGPIANGQAYLPQTALVLEFLQEPLAKIGMLVVIFFTVELFWNERMVKIAPLIDCTPTQNSTFYLTKLATALAIGFTLILVSIVTAVLFQFSQGEFNVQPQLYLLLFYYSGVPMLLVALLTLFLQRFAKAKAIGLLLGLSVFVLNGLAKHLLIDHPLTVFAYQPYFIFSEMADTIYHAEAVHWYNLYWLSIAGVLGVLTVKYWQRGASNVAQHLTTIGKLALASFLVLGVGSGSYIFYQTNVFNQFYTEKQQVALMADYEKNYRQFENQPMPTIIDVNVEMDIFPEQRKYQVTGRYVIENQTSAPISQVLVSVLRQSHVEYQVNLQGADLTQHDKTHQTMLFSLKEPLIPHATTTVDFTIAATHNAFGELDGEHYVTAGGSYIELEDVIPQFGFMDYYVLIDADARKEHQLPELARTMPSHEMQVQMQDRLNFSAVISTSSEQTAVTVGKLNKQWSEKGRNYFHYQSGERIKAQLAVVSANFDVTTKNHNGVELMVFHHPEHSNDNDMILTALTQSMDYFATHYQPYHAAQYSVVEIPYFSSLQSFGSAQPGMYVGVENRMFNLDSRHVNLEEANPQLRGIAHEFAHQYWGDYIEPHYIAGAPLLTETLAKYTELVVTRAVYGETSAFELVNNSLDMYLKMRSYMTEYEQPLFTMGHEPHLFYGKGQHSMYALLDVLGEEKINRALQQLLVTKGYPYKPTSLDLLSVFYRQASKEQVQRIDDLFKHVVFHEFELHSADTTQMNESKYMTTIDVSTLKYSVDLNASSERQVPMQEEVQVALYDGYPAYDDSNALVIEKVAFNNDRSKITLYSDTKPSHVQIDPKLFQIDRNLANNIITVN
ncbi:M1 family aminopeptidase [Thalassotalea fusca]